MIQSRIAKLFIFYAFLLDRIVFKLSLHGYNQMSSLITVVNQISFQKSWDKSIFCFGLKPGQNESSNFDRGTKSEATLVHYSRSDLIKNIAE